MMNIQNIQIAHGFFRADEEKNDSGRGAVSAESDPSAPGMNLPQAQQTAPPDQSISSEAGAGALETCFPPFFPLGNTQGIYAVVVEAKTDNSLSESVETQKGDNEPHTEAVAEPQRAAANKKDESIQNHAPDTEETAHPGSVLDLKV